MSDTLVRIGRRRAHDDEHAPGPHPDPVTGAQQDDSERAAWLEQLRADLAKSLNGSILRGARPFPLRATGNSRPSTSADTLVGWSIRETTGTAGATVVFYNGQDANADELAAVTLIAGESARDWFGPGGISVGDAGLFVAVTTGSVAGSIFLGGVE